MSMGCEDHRFMELVPDHGQQWTFRFSIVEPGSNLKSKNFQYKSDAEDRAFFTAFLDNIQITRVHLSYQMNLYTSSIC